MRGTPHSQKLHHYCSHSIILLRVISGHSLREFYPFAEMQSVYSTAPADWSTSRRTLNVSLVPRKGQTRAQVVTRFNTLRQNTAEEDNMDNKQIKACRPAWGNKGLRHILESMIQSVIKIENI